MYDGKQVVRVINNYKKKDLYNIGVEMNNRKGTGNYDKERTQFNIEYVSLNETNLYKEVKTILKNKNIEFNNKPSTNLLNGITFTSGPEFFQVLGMNFIDSGRTYHTGDKKGQSILVPNIKSESDIPPAVSYYFDSCMEFLKQYVGDENIVLAQIHYDEDTPHLQAYFIPVVNKVNRKCYVKDNDGNVVKEEIIKKDGTKTIVPKLLRDSNGKIIYEEVEGNFLNCDQFWKDKGGKLSFSKLQDEFNKFITERGFNLYRGDIGSNKINQTKLEYDISEKKAELEELNKEKENVLKIIENSKNGLEMAEKAENKKELLNPTKRKIGGIKETDVTNIIEYTKNLQKEVVLLKTDSDNKDIIINKLSKENKTYKDNKELIKRNKIIKEQKATIKEQNQEINRLNSLVDILNHNIESLKLKFENEIEKWKQRFNKLCDAIDKVLGREPKDYIEDYENLADSINYGYYEDNKNDKDDLDIGF